MSKANNIFIIIITIVFGYGLYLTLHKPPQISTQQKIAVVNFISGEVLCRHFLQSDWKQLQLNEVIFNKDIVKTGPNAQVRLLFTENENEILLSEKTSAEIKSSAVKVNEGSIENDSKGDNPFAISIGDVQVVLKVRDGSLKSLKDSSSIIMLIESRVELLKKLEAEDKIKLLISEFKKVKENNDIVEMEVFWRKLNNLLSELQAKKQKVKITKSDDGKIKAQVSEGKVSLNIDGTVGAVEVKEGHGLILDKEKGEVEQVKLLKAPIVQYPKNNSVVFNQTSVQLSWFKIVKAVRYELSLVEKKDIENEALKNKNLSISANTYVYNNLTYGKDYVLIIAGLDEHDFKGKMTKVNFSLEEDKIPPKLEIEDIKF
jgi:hypothetical protein